MLAAAAGLLLLAIWMEEFALIGVPNAAVAGIACLAGCALALARRWQLDRRRAVAAGALAALARATGRSSSVRAPHVTLQRFFRGPP